MTPRERTEIIAKFLDEGTERETLLGTIEAHIERAMVDECEAILNIIRAHSFEVARVGTSVNALIDTIAARKGRA